MTSVTCPLCLTDLPPTDLSPAAPGAAEDEPVGSREQQRRLDRALWAAVHALQEQATAAGLLLQLRPDASGTAQRVAADLQAQVELLHGVLRSRSGTRDSTLV